ncbi:MAG: hypothetical protein F6J93_06130 [Oscillatoria sp. SIO1A7]|nr:hypothetical protein [Oscillatoria sp. SIO1A7]
MVSHINLRKAIYSVWCYCSTALRTLLPCPMPNAQCPQCRARLYNLKLAEMPVKLRRCSIKN